LPPSSLHVLREYECVSLCMYVEKRILLRPRRSLHLSVYPVFWAFICSPITRNGSHLYSSLHNSHACPLSYLYSRNSHVYILPSCIKTKPFSPVLLVELRVPSPATNPPLQQVNCDSQMAASGRRQVHGGECMAASSWRRVHGGEWIAAVSGWLQADGGHRMAATRWRRVDGDD